MTQAPTPGPLSEPVKGAANGLCNRTACQAPLAGEPQHQFMDGNFTGGPRLHYCAKCAADFDAWDYSSGDMVRIQREPKNLAPTAQFKANAGTRSSDTYARLQAILDDFDSDNAADIDAEDFNVDQDDFIEIPTGLLRKVLAGLAPTAPVEASGSERETERFRQMVEAKLAEAMRAEHADAPFPMDEHQAASYHRTRADLLGWVLDMLPPTDGPLIPVRPQPSGFLATLTDDQRAAALAHTGDDTHPQPSVETREAWTESFIADEEGGPVAGICIDLPDGSQIWSGECSKTLLDEASAKDESPDESGQFLMVALKGAATRVVARVSTVDDGVALARAYAALLSARPLALRGQQGEGIDRAWLIDIINEHSFASDAADMILERLSTTPARAEAQDEGGAGEPVAWRWKANSTHPILGHATNEVNWNVTTGHPGFKIEGGLDPSWFDIQPLYAHPSPTPAADADRVREAIEKLEWRRNARELGAIKEALDTQVQGKRAEYKARVLSSALVEVDYDALCVALAALKSTAAKEGVAL